MFVTALKKITDFRSISERRAVMFRTDFFLIRSNIKVIVNRRIIQLDGMIQYESIGWGVQLHGSSA